MKKNQTLIEIPYGTRDFLPKEAAAKRVIEQKMAGLFAQWGYEEVVTPTMEYLDTLTMGNGRSLEKHMFKLFDRHNHTMALRHEMTTPIARLAAGRLKESPLPLKLSYISSVFRYEQAQAGRQCEFYQAGVELMGQSAATADAEIIALAIESLQTAGIDNFSLCLGQVEFVSGIMEQNGLDTAVQDQIKSAMERNDLVGLNEIVDELQLSKAAADALKEIPLLHGGEEILKKAYQMALNERSRRALDNLSEIYRLLDKYEAASYVVFDLGMIRDFNYYTGMVFEAYTPGLGFPLCGGGRYDRMLADFGMACPATGFAVGIERVLLALERQGLEKPSAARHIYIGYDAARVGDAIQKAMECRREGKSAELALFPQTEAEAIASQQAKGYKDLLYLI